MMKTRNRKRKRYPRFLQLTNGQIANHDPDMLRLNEQMHMRGLQNSKVAKDSGIATSTIRNWRKLKTRYPQHVTMQSVAFALGYRYILSRDKKD